MQHPRNGGPAINYNRGVMSAAFPIPAPGRIVHYKLTSSDAQSITQRRAASNGIFSGNPVNEGDVFPAQIVKAWGDTPESACQLQVMLDGNDTLWVTSRTHGEQPGSFVWPPRV